MSSSSADYMLLCLTPTPESGQPVPNACPCCWQVPKHLKPTFWTSDISGCRSFNIFW